MECIEMNSQVLPAANRYFSRFLIFELSVFYSFEDTQTWNRNAHAPIEVIS